MKFGFDIDGTISAAPGPFRQMMLALRAYGHEVHVITGQMRPVVTEDIEKRKNQLRCYGIEDECWDYLHLAQPPDWVLDKHNYCRDNDIEFMFEDSAVYGAAIKQVCPVTLMLE